MPEPEIVAQNEANASESKSARLYLIRWDDDEWHVIRAHGIPAARALAYEARARDVHNPRIIDIEEKEID